MEHGGRIFQAADKLAISPREIIDFSANINVFFGLSAIHDLIKEHIDYIRFYPDPEVRQGRRALADFVGRPEGNIAVGNGGTQLIHLLPQALRSRKVVIPVPTFSEYERGMVKVGAEVSFLPLAEEDDFSLRADALLSACDRAVDMVILCNPNNPTGQLIHEEELAEIERHLRKKGIWLVVDEAFLDFVPGHKRPPLLERTIDGHVILLRSLTKCLAIPGIRLGYLIAPGDVVEKIVDLSPTWSINCFAQIVLENLRDLYKRFEKGLPQLFEERDFLAEELQKDFTVFPSETNFLLLKSKGPTSAKLTDDLLQHRILVRDCSNFRGLGEGFIRVAVRKREENLKLLNTIREVL
jgi:threonine-phosphate decarboxylase